MQVPLEGLVRILASCMGKEASVSPDVKGEVTLDLHWMPYAEALDAVLASQGDFEIVSGERTVAVFPRGGKPPEPKASSPGVVPAALELPPNPPDLPGLDVRAIVVDPRGGSRILVGGCVAKVGDRLHWQNGIEVVVVAIWEGAVRFRYRETEFVDTLRRFTGN